MSFKYDNLISHCRYAPWLEDESFIKVYNSIINNTLVDQYRCYELWHLAQQATKISGDFIEIGVWKGGTGALVAKQIQQLGNQKIYLCDNFHGCVKSTNNDSTYRGGEHADCSQEEVQNLLNKLDINNATILSGIFPEETSYLIPPDTKFSFCHIDVDMYQSAKDITDYIWNKMSIGDMIIHDDYGIPLVDGITICVNEQMQKSDRIIIHNINGHAVIVKIK